MIHLRDKGIAMIRMLYTLLLVLSTAAGHAQCTDLFFSEYVEGSSNNKALEIYNASGSTIDLTGYRVQLYSNGNTNPTSTFNLSGNLAAGATYVICNSSAAAYIKSLADTTSGVTNFNGNDAIVLLKGNDTLDVIGIVGNDPGSGGWAVGTGSTTDKTLVRSDTVKLGTKDWSIGATQWLVLPKDTIMLKQHTMQPCPPSVAFGLTSDAVNESAGTYSISITLNTPATISYTVDVKLTGGTGDASDIGMFTGAQVTFGPGDVTKTVSINITDDNIQEPAETLIFTLQNPSSGLLIGANATFTLTIAASDVPVVKYNISQITGLDADFKPDSLGAKVVVTGTVIGIDYRANGLEFFIHDGTDGIQVFSPSNTFGYTVNEGDSVQVEGEVSFFNGVTQIAFLDTVFKVGTGAVPAPAVVQDLDENTEAELIRLNYVNLVNPSQWTGSGANGFNCSITDGQKTWTLRIDEQCALYSQPAPQGKFHVIGIGSQFDATSPYDGGYQILPRYVTDIILVTGTDDMEKLQVSVFPNPGRDKFYLFAATAGETQVLVTDITGKTIHRSTFYGAQHTLALENAAPGWYMVELLQNGKYYRTKLLVQ
ncbi:MAG: lamin tail domain-containing protein [Chitinophagales bacterium]|nr:lamin tail domain-containing protein [Chitinophagales bacterium]MDW8418713.1 lamin tail domain-containing protein [Chitinophagales bacterium]